MENSAAIPQAATTLTIPERVVPEGNLIANLNKLARVFSLITKRSHIRIGKADVGSERPLSLRNQRAQLYNELVQTSTTNQEGRTVVRQRVFSEAHDRDEIARQYLNQGEVRVKFPGLGEQMARYTIIRPPEDRRTAESKPPIFFIPGISNDLDCVGALVQEIPFMGRRVIVVGMPESQMGRVTSEFAQAVAESPSFALHADFFKAAINSLLGEQGQMELWGHSAGGGIISEMLNDHKFRERVTEAVLLNPASSANISPRDLNLGILHELRNLLGRNFSKYTLTAGTEPSVLQRADQKKLKEVVSAAILKKVCTRSERWKTARVRRGGKIVVYSGRQDQLTRSYEQFREELTFQAWSRQINPQLEVIYDPKGFHSTVLTEPQRIINQVFARQAA